MQDQAIIASLMKTSMEQNISIVIIIIIVITIEALIRCCLTKLSGAS